MELVKWNEMELIKRNRITGHGTHEIGTQHM